MDKKDFSKYIFDIYSHGALTLAISIGHELGIFKEFYGTDEPLSVQCIAEKLTLKERMDKKDFSKYIFDIYSHGALTLAISIGHELGIFKEFYGTDEPLSVQCIAEKLTLKERYTKEWLSCMVAAGIIHQDRQTNLYTMPRDHQEVLRIQSAVAPMFPLYASRSELVKKCFRKDGPYGFGYDDEAWVKWTTDHKFAAVDNTLDNELIPYLTKQGMNLKLESGISVLDLGCGVGSFTIGLAKRYPKSHITGLEYTDKILKVAEEVTKKTNLDNITYVKGDAHNLPGEWTEKFDFVFVHDLLHDLPNPQKALAEIYRVIKTDGAFALVDFNCHSDPKDNAGNMAAAMLYLISMFVCLPCSLSEEPRIGYGSCWGVEEIEKALLGARFNIQNKSVFMGIQSFYYCKK